MSKRRFFPWRLFWKFFFSLLFLLNGLCLATMAIASFVFNFEFFSSKNLIFGGSFFLISLIGALAFSYQFSVPMRRVILKALRMANKKQYYEISGRSTGEVETVEDNSLFETEPGEYFELEHALDQIRKKMSKRREQLAHEREEAQTLMSSIEDGVVNVGPDGKLLYFNSSFAAHFINKDQVQSSYELLVLTKVMRDSEVLSYFERALKNGEGGNIHRSMTTLVGGGIHYFSITISPLRDPKTKEIYAALGLFHDITELKKIEKIRMEFVANASHELRTPLTTVKGYLETFKEDFFKGETHQAEFFLNTISKNVNRLTDLVNDLLTISSLEQGVAPELENISVDHMTSDVIERLASLAKDKNVRLNFSTGDVQTIRADVSKLEQVLENLIANGIKYGKNQGKVDVRWSFIQSSLQNSEASQPLKSIQLSVQDDGLGIAEEHLPRLFERFYRVDKARSREVGGTGLGLSIVKHIVQSHGGSVYVKSELGKGTEFICTFPVRGS
jgi:two-component system phosphate regulon sensor histidine kinase PhoR